MDNAAAEVLAVDFGSWREFNLLQVGADGKATRTLYLRLRNTGKTVLTGCTVSIRATVPGLWKLSGRVLVSQLRLPPGRTNLVPFASHPEKPGGGLFDRGALSIPKHKGARFWTRPVTLPTPRPDRPLTLVLEASAQQSASVLASVRLWVEPCSGRLRAVVA